MKNALGDAAEHEPLDRSMPARSDHDEADA
jgi:hypothetical protein